jgi:hypothetical protein
MILISLFIILLPLIFSFSTEQIFSVNKFITILFFTGFFSLFFGIKTFLNKRLITYNKSFVLVIIFLFALLGSIYFSKTPIEAFFGGSARHFGSLFLIILLFIFHYLIFLQLDKSKYQIYIFYPFLFIGFLSALWASFQYFGIFPIFNSLQLEALSFRSFAGMGQPNFLAQFLIIPFSITLYFLLNYIKTKNTLLKIFYLLFSIFIFFAIFSTGSRAGFIASLFIIFLYLIYSFVFLKNKDIKIFKWGIYSVLIFILIIWLSIFLFGNNISNFLGDRGASIEARHYFWNDSLVLIKDYFLWGVGGDLLQPYLSKTLSVNAFAAENFSATPDRTHTFLIDFLLHFGLIPFIIFWFWVYKTIQRAYLNIQNSDTISIFSLITIIGLIFTWSVGFPVLTDSIFFVILCSIVWRNNIKKILLNNFYKYLIIFLSIVFAIFCFYLGFLIYKSETSLFSLKRDQNLSEESKNIYLNNILRTPFLSENILSVFYNLNFKDQQKIMNLIYKYQFNNVLIKELEVYFFVKNNDISKAKRSFFIANHNSGNHFVKQFNLLIKSFYLGIFTEQEFLSMLKNTYDLIPDIYIKNPDMNNLKVQKFWKHHKQIMEIFDKSDIKY